MLSCLTIALLVGAFTAPATAQDDTTLVFGQPQLGRVDNPAGTTFNFQAEANDTVTIEVAGLNNFIPTITLLDPVQTAIAQEPNAGQQTTITLQTTLPTPGTYFVNVGGVNSTLGQFTIVLNRGLPPGLPLNPTGPTEGAIAPELPDVYYDVPLDPANNTALQIRSLTEGYNPQVTVFDETGNEIATLTSQRLLAATLEFEPGEEVLKLLIELGEFTEQASFEITTERIAPATTDAGPVATQEPSDSGAPPATSTECRVSTGDSGVAVNARSGGSTDYPEIGQLLPGQNVPATGFNTANGGWFQVQLVDGTIAWVASFVVTTTGDCATLPLASYPPLGSDDGPVETEEPSEGTATATTTPTATLPGQPTATLPGQPTATATGTPTVSTQPTATPTPSFTPTATASPTAPIQTAPPDNQQQTVEVDLSSNNNQIVLTGDVSYPTGDTADRIRYEVTGFTQSRFSADILVTFSCTGSGASNARISSNFGRNGPQQPCNGYSRTQTHTDDSDFANYEIYLDSGDNVYVSWTMVITVLQ